MAVNDIDASEMRELLAQSAKLAVLSGLLAEVTHELNNSLTGVVVYSQLLMDSELEPKAQRHLERLSNIEMAPLDLNDTLTSTVELKSYALKVANIRVELQFEPNLPNIQGRIGQRELVFLNLINNAQQAMFEAHRGGLLQIRTARAAENVLVTITDDGPGIKAENLNRVFEPFFTTKESSDGTGLGLSISSDTVRRHGGRIWTESESGQGATFYVELPKSKVNTRIGDTRWIPEV